MKTDRSPNLNGEGHQRLAFADSIISPDALVLVTGAAGFMGPRVVESLLRFGLRRIRCLARPSSKLARLQQVIEQAPPEARIDIVRGNLLSRDDCLAVTRDVTVIYHLAAGRGEKAFADAFLNSVVTTRNLVEAALQQPGLKRFVSISSFSVYSNEQNGRGNVLDENCPLDPNPALRGDAYSFAKLKQEEIVSTYGKTHRLPYVILRPGVVYGPGNHGIHGRVGIGTHGLFLHLGGSNTIPLTYVENCADAIALAGIKTGIEGRAFNVVDDDLPTSRRFLKMYKSRVKPFRSVYVPHPVSYLLCWLWEKYSSWSEGQLPPTYGRAAWQVYWKPTRYTNATIKSALGWSQRVPSSEALTRHFASCKRTLSHA